MNETFYDLRGIFLGLWRKFKCNTCPIMWTEKGHLRGVPHGDLKGFQICYHRSTNIYALGWKGRLLEREKVLKCFSLKNQ